MKKYGNNGYIVISDYMLRGLCLEGKELLIYALISSFTSDGGECVARSGYIAARVAASKRTVTRCIRSLLDRGLIKKQGSGENAGYVAVENVGDLPERSLPTKESSEERSTKMLPRYSLVYLGNNNDIRMSREQYDDLLARVDSDVLEEYIWKLDRHIHGSIPCDLSVHLHSAYKTIRKWLEEDLGVGG